VVDFERSVLAHLSAPSMAKAAEDLEAIFKARREETG
jgi:hypothetical protein